MKKIFEKKFASDADATTYLESTGWDYVGEHGFFSKYHLYKGVEVDGYGVLQEIYELRLKNNGHVVLYADYQVGRTLTTTSLPHFVWATYEAYKWVMQDLEVLNAKLMNEQGGKYCVEWSNKDRQFSVFAMEDIENYDLKGGSKIKGAKVAMHKTLHEVKSALVAV